MDDPVKVACVQAEPVVLDGPSVKDRVKELVLFSISEDYFAIRRKLQINID